MAVSKLSNEDVADALERVAELLRVQQANPYRVRAYQDAARTIRSERRSVPEILTGEGPAGLERLPRIGKRLASSLEELVRRGRLPLLDRLLDQVSPEDLFTTVPGIGEKLARRLHRELGVETLEELELAAHDGRLERVPGFGSRRTRLVRDTVGAMLRRSTRRRARLIGREENSLKDHPPLQPPVDLLLKIDARYRKLAAAGKLLTIAPRRFNPEGKAWLPLLHLDAGGWSFTAMFSNTARAHELGKTGDWVVIYYERDGLEGQCTAVTEVRGPLSGCRVVRGREGELVSLVG